MAKSQPISTRTSSDRKPAIDKWFRAAIKTEASDLHLKAGMSPRMRMRGKLKDTTGKQLTEETIEKLVFEIMSDEQKKFFLANGVLDFAHQVDKNNRFRINIFRQRGTISLSARRIISDIPPFEDLHLPSIVEKIADFHEGLVLVTGPTGSGKTTTIASMINHINNTRPCHVITIEDPIEFLHVDKKALVSQREIGIDVPDYDDAIRSMMRQDPDVVFIGELRDNETFTAAMRAAETGHLVFGTLHAANAAQTIKRIMDLFGPNERDMVRQIFALTFRAAISQMLLPCLKKDVRRVPAIEILLANPIVRKLISEQRDADLLSVIRVCGDEGMQDFTDSLCKLVKEGWIDLETAIQHAPNAEELEMAIKGIRNPPSGIL